MYTNDSIEKVMRYSSFSHMLHRWKLIRPLFATVAVPGDRRMEFEAENSETGQKDTLCFQAFPSAIFECVPEGSEEDRYQAMLYREAIDHARNHFMDCEFFECAFRHKNGYDCVQRIVISIWPVKTENIFPIQPDFALKKEHSPEIPVQSKAYDQVEEAGHDAGVQQEKKEGIQKKSLGNEENAAEELEKKNAVRQEETKEKNGAEKSGLYPVKQTMKKETSCCRIEATTGGYLYGKKVHKSGALG